MRKTLFAMALTVASFALASTASAQTLGIKERLVLGSFNMCWEGEDQPAILATRLRENGFSLAPNSQSLHMRQEQNTTILFVALYRKDDRGEPETYCRITALKPQIVSQWTPKEPIFNDFAGLLDRIINATGTMSGGYRLITHRQPISNLAGHRKTALHLDQRTRGRLIHIEEGPTHYEFVYVNASRATIASPETVATLIQPDARAAMQMMVDDSWEIAFCKLNPGNCLTEEQQRQQAEMAARAARQREPIPIPFSGIGAIRSGDNRSHDQRLRDRAFWENYHRCGSGRC